MNGIICASCVTKRNIKETFANEGRALKEIDLINNEDLFKAAEALLLHVDEDDGRCYHIANDDGISSLAEDDGTMTERLIGNDDRRSLFLVVVSSVGTKIMGGNDDEAGSSRPKRSRQYKTVEEVLLPQVHHEFLEWEGCNRDAKTRTGCGDEIDEMLRINLCETGSNEEIFTYVAWIRAFNINEPIYSDLCHEFYSTYEFDEVFVDDELKTKKIIKFRLGGRAHSLTLLEFARRLGLYHAKEVDEEGFDVYFARRNLVLRVLHKMITYGLCQRTTGYDKIQKNDLCLLSMFDARHQNGYANVAWLIARWMKRKGAGTQGESLICYGQFITKLARKARVLSDEVLRSLSALIYCRDLDTTTLRELINSEGRLIPEAQQPDIPRVVILRA
ncbi:hypothetical protein Tco_1106615 [Tanacetum coccineum]